MVMAVAAQQPIVYVVSLPSAHERRGRMQARLQRQRLEHVIVDALDRDDPKVQLYRDPEQDTRKTRGIAACLASHLHVLRLFSASDDEEAIVVEDDVVLAKTFAERFTELRANIPDDCPLVCLGYLVWQWVGYHWAGRTPERKNICTMGPDTWGSQMYWIRKTWAHDCIERLDRPFAEIKSLQTSEAITRDAGARGGLVACPPLALEDLTGSLLVPEAGNANHAEGQARWDISAYDTDLSKGIAVTNTADEARYIHMPGHSDSVRVEGFPAVILNYRAESVSSYRASGEHVIIPGRYERDLVDWACELAPASKQFVDCGAHMGSWTLVMARHFREVYAFEPQRLVFQQLCGNVTLNGLHNVFAYNAGLDEKPGQLDLHCHGVDRGGSSARQDVTARFQASGVLTAAESIAVTTLDSFAANLNDVGLIKIDVEGLELRVLKGAVEVLRKNHLPKMLIECWSHDWYQNDKQDLLKFLDSLGYDVVPINRYPDVMLAGPR